MDSASLPRIMVSMAQERSLPAVLRSIVQGIAQCQRVALARIWLIAPGDICATCRVRAECPDQTRCLHLVASAGNPSDGISDYERTDGAFRRFPIGVRKIGQVAQTGEPLLVPGLRGDEAWIADPAWRQREGVMTIAAQPLTFRGEVLGVLAIFDRAVLDAQQFEWLRVFADHGAVSIANARAFEEIDRLRVQLEEENAYLREEVTSALGVGDFVGDSPALRKVMQQIRLVAPTDATVLVTGESGTGKELVARAIHERSQRGRRALIRVNCSAVPDGLFESDFFGHVRGAFTGALRDKPGRFELASGGTLFLDEICEVPFALQPKLLRVLQEQELERVGDVRTRKVDVRVVAATNRDVKREVDAGRFRQDLFYRMSVFPIEMPPLRDRREDIPALVRHFLAQSAQRLNRPAPRLTQAAMGTLVAYPWPGNVRELQNVIERAVISSGGGPLRLDIAPPSQQEVSRPPMPATALTQVLTRDDLKRQERDGILAALKQCGGRVSGPNGAAALMRMRPTTLSSRIRALGLARLPMANPQ